MEWNYFTLETWNISGVFHGKLEAKRFLAHISWNYVIFLTMCFVTFHFARLTKFRHWWLLVNLYNNYSKFLHNDQFIYYCLSNSALAIFFFHSSYMFLKRRDHLSTEQWLDGLHKTAFFLNNFPLKCLCK